MGCAKVIRDQVALGSAWGIEDDGAGGGTLGLWVRHGGGAVATLCWAKAARLSSLFQAYPGPCSEPVLLDTPPLLGFLARRPWLERMRPRLPRIVHHLLNLLPPTQLLQHLLMPPMPQCQHLLLSVLPLLLPLSVSSLLFHLSVLSLPPLLPFAPPALLLARILPRTPWTAMNHTTWFAHVCIFASAMPFLSSSSSSSYLFSPFCVKTAQS